MQSSKQIMELDLKTSRHNSFDLGNPMSIMSVDDLDENVRRQSSPATFNMTLDPTPEETAEPEQAGCFIRIVEKIQDGIHKVLTENQKYFKKGFLAVLLLMYLAYVGYSLYFRFGDEGSWRLLICTILGLLYMGWQIIKGLSCYQSFKESLGPKNPEIIVKAKKILRWSLYFIVIAFVIIYIGLTVAQHSPRNLVSLIGLAIFVFSLFLMSKDKANIKWHTVFWGLSLQFTFALVILRTSWGIGSIRWATDRFSEFIAYSDNGAEFIFSERYVEFDIIFKAVPSVIVFCAAIAVLSYFGILAFIISNVGGFLGYCLQTNAVESINAATNIFMSGIESLMVINEYVSSLTKSQLFCIYTNGVSSIAGSALVVFATFGVPVEYLLTASVMSAPAALVAAKMAYPSEKSKDENKKYILNTHNRPKSVMESLSIGGMQGLQLMVNVIINLLIYISAFAFVNATVTWFGDRAGVEQLTLEKIFSYILWPVAFIMGIDFIDCLKVAEMLGVRMFATLALSYIQLGQYFDNKEQWNMYTTSFNDTVLHSNGDIFLPQWNKTLDRGILTDRSELIATYAMCGFASLPSIGISLGSFAALAPDRLDELSKMAFRGLIAGTLASYLTACVAGLLF